MFTRTCGLLVLCLCFAKVNLGADQQSPPRAEPIPHAAQQKDATTQPLGERPDEIRCSCKFVEVTPTAAAEFYAAADLATPRLPHDSPPPGFAVYKNAQEALRKLRKSGRAKILAFPEITTTTDKAATAMSGGEFPILIPTAGNRVSIKWMQFGCRFECLPHWLDSGRLQLQLAPEIAAKDMKHSVVANGLTIPGLTTRRVCGRVEMNLGETAVVNLGPTSEDQDEAHAITLFMVTPVAADSSSN